MASPVVVTFVRFHPPYNEGEKAGFDAATAADFVARKIAILSTPVLERVAVVKSVEPEPVKPEPMEVQATPIPPVQPTQSADRGRKGHRR